jgi:hypothetical protein
MNSQLTSKQLDTIQELLQPATDAPDTVKERALTALALDASDRALEILRQAEPGLPKDLLVFWDLAVSECEHFNKGPRLDEALEELGPLLDLPPAEGGWDELQQQCEAWEQAFDERGIAFAFEDEEPVGRRVAVMRAVFECIGDLRFNGFGHFVIDRYYAPEAPMIRATA